MEMNSEEVDSELDCIGLYCPQPLFQTRKAIDELEPGQVLQVLSDDPAAKSDLERFCKRTGHELLSYDKLGDGVQVFLIKKRANENE